MHKAVAIAETTGDDRTRAEALVRLSHTADALGRAEDARVLVAEAVAILERREPDRLLAEALVELGYTQSLAGRMQEALATCEQVLSLIERLDLGPRMLLAALMVRCELRLATGDADGITDLDLAEQELAALGDPTLVGDVHWSRGLAATLVQGWPEAVRLFDLAIAAAEATGQRIAVVLIGANLVEALIQLGRSEEAERRCQELIDSLDEERNAAHVANLRALWARSLVLRGEVDGARQLLEAALPVARLDVVSWFVPVLLVNAERAHAVAPEGPNPSLDELVGLLQEPELQAALSTLLPRAARVLVARGRRDLVEAWVEAVPAGLPAHDHAVRTTRALLADADGDRDLARRLYAEAAAGWAELGDELERAHAALGATGPA